MNTPLLDLRLASNRHALTEALAQRDAAPPIEASCSIGGDTRRGDDILSSNPGDPDRVVATAAAEPQRTSTGRSSR